MPPSMRAQTLANKRRINKRKEGRASRAQLLYLMQEGKSAFQASKKTGVSRTTATKSKAAYDRSSRDELQKLLDPENNHAGRKTVLSQCEEKLVIERTLHAAKHGFAVENSIMSTVHARIAADRCVKYAHGLPSPDHIRSFRARNRSLAYCVAENVSSARLAAENQSHVLTLKQVFEKVEQEHPGFFWIHGAFGTGTRRPYQGSTAGN